MILHQKNRTPKDGKMALLTIAIPTYKREASLQNCLISIVHGLSPSELKQLKLVISDNDPNSTVSKMLEGKLFPEELRVVYSQNSENIGADRNILRCIELSEDSEYWWLLGDDDYPQPEVVSTLLKNLAQSSPDCVFMECRGQLWTTFLPSKPFTLFYRTVFLAYVNFYTTFISAFVWKLESVKSCITDPNRPKGTFLDQLGWVLPIIRGSNQFLVCPRQAFTGGEESTGGYNLTEVFVTNFWRLWRRYVLVSDFRFRWFPYYSCRTLMLIGFYPQILLTTNSSSKKFQFSSDVTIAGFRGEFRHNLLYWLFVEPCIVLPALFGNFICKLLLPLRLACTLCVIGTVKASIIGKKLTSGLI
jgi:glycosyltransferase involved in cell wall biosynthesis